jgi:hypothetical protein
MFHFVLPWYFHGDWSVIARNFFITLILGAVRSTFLSISS